MQILLKLLTGKSSLIDGERRPQILAITLEVQENDSILNVKANI
jgi:hypothetical protein